MLLAVRLSRIRPAGLAQTRVATLVLAVDEGVERVGLARRSEGGATAKADDA
jgi:hypothetical protein